MKDLNLERLLKSTIAAAVAGIILAAVVGRIGHSPAIFWTGLVWSLVVGAGTWFLFAKVIK